MISKRFVVGFSVVLLGAVSIADAQSSSKSNADTASVSMANKGGQDSISFVNDVAPIINARCGRCHVQAARGRYDIKSYDALMNSDSVEPNQPGDSQFIEVIEDGSMPKGGGKVSDAELEILRQWIEEGAQFDGSDDETQSIASMGNSSGGSARGGSRGNSTRGGARGGSTRGGSTRGGARGNAPGAAGGAAAGRSTGRRPTRPSGRRGTSSRPNAFSSNALLQFLDRDGNGELSLAEIDAAKRLLYSLDANEDDRLTGDEVKDIGNK